MQLSCSLSPPATVAQKFLTCITKRTAGSGNYVCMTGYYEAIIIRVVTENCLCVFMVIVGCACVLCAYVQRV
jgi:hypothetical protein